MCGLSGKFLNVRSSHGVKPRRFATAPLAVFSGGLVTLLQVLFVEQQQQGAFGNFLASGSAVILILVFLVSLVCAALVMPMATLRYAMHGSVLAGLAGAAR